MAGITVSVTRVRAATSTKWRNWAAMTAGVPTWRYSAISSTMTHTDGGLSGRSRRGLGPWRISVTSHWQEGEPASRSDDQEIHPERLAGSSSSSHLHGYSLSPNMKVPQLSKPPASAAGGMYSVAM